MSLGKRVERGTACHAEAGLQAAGLVIQARMDDPAAAPRRAGTQILAGLDE